MKKIILILATLFIINSDSQAQKIYLSVALGSERLLNLPGYDEEKATTLTALGLKYFDTTNYDQVGFLTKYYTLHVNQSDISSAGLYNYTISRTDVFIEFFYNVKLYRAYDSTVLLKHMIYGGLSLGIPINSIQQVDSAGNFKSRDVSLDYPTNGIGFNLGAMSNYGFLEAQLLLKPNPINGGSMIITIPLKYGINIAF